MEMLCILYVHSIYIYIYIISLNIYKYISIRGRHSFSQRCTVSRRSTVKPVQLMAMVVANTDCTHPIDAPTTHATALPRIMLATLACQRLTPVTSA